MFSNLSMIEMAVIVIVAILVVGPKDLPKMLRGIGKTLGTFKRMAGDFQRQFKDAIDDAELDEIKNMAKGDIDPLKDAKEAMAGIKESVADPMRPAPQVEVKPPKETSKAKTSKAAPKKAAPKKAAPKKTTKAATTVSEKPKPTAKKPAAKSKPTAAKTASKKTAPVKTAAKATKTPAPKKAAAPKKDKTT